MACDVTKRKWYRAILIKDSKCNDVRDFIEFCTMDQLLNMIDKQEYIFNVFWSCEIKRHEIFYHDYYAYERKPEGYLIQVCNTKASKVGNGNQSYLPGNFLKVLRCYSDKSIDSFDFLEAFGDIGYV